MRHLWIVLVVSASVFGTLAPAQTRLYSVNLREQGCPIVEHKPFTWESELWAVTRHLGFDRAGNIYVGCAIQGEAKLLKPGEANNTFRVLKIGAESGKAIQKLDFPTQSKERTGIYVSANDSLLVIADDKVQLLGGDGSIKATFDIPIDGENEFLVTDESVSGRTLLVLVRGSSGKFPYFFSADTLSLVTHCEIPVIRLGRDSPSTIADDVQMADYQNSYVKGGPPPRNRLVMGPLCGQTKDLWGVVPGVEPFLLDDATVLEVGESQDDYTSILEVRKVNGGALWSWEFPNHYVIVGWVSAAQDGSRFAVGVIQTRGGHRALDIGPKTVAAWIWVLDAKTGKRLGSIPISTNGNLSGNLRYAVSPNGDRVAVLSADGSTLEVWEL